MNATSITAVQPLHVAARIEMQQQECAALRRRGLCVTYGHHWVLAQHDLARTAHFRLESDRLLGPRFRGDDE